MKRLNDLKQRRSTPLLEVFPVSLYSASWVKDYGGSIGERQLIYDQVARAWWSDVSEEAVDFLNAALMPSRADNALLKDKKGITNTSAPTTTSRVAL